jgi:1,4-alpha-glucan branching enzyme
MASDLKNVIELMETSFEQEALKTQTRSNQHKTENSMAKKKTRTAAKSKTAPAPAVAGSQTFRCKAPDASSVLLAGDFTHWQERPIPLERGPDGVWQATVALPPGTHHYRFIVDSEWRDDPECTLRVPNPFGGENCVRKVS